MIRNYAMIFTGIALFAFGWTAFLLPNNLTGAGVSGIGAVLSFATGLPIVGITSFVLNAILLIFAWRILGPRFCVNTLICSAVLALFLSVGQKIFTHPLVEDDLFMSAIIGSAISAFGVGIAINFGGNTGGTDILALIVQKYRNISYGRVTLYTNILIVSSSILVPEVTIKAFIYSFTGMFVSFYVSDLVIEGYRQSFQFLVFSTKNQEIADRINRELDRGATFLKGYGAYSKQENDILLIVAHRTDRAQIIRIIRDTDSSAFISVAKASSVFGKNFDKIKV
jgi:uncharacterized membrane-anchored protein YitT (DUF2179 family)